MARPRKAGLDYFYRDVLEWDDFRVMRLVEAFGPTGYAVYDVVLCWVYQHGYYLEAPMDILALYVMRMVGNRWVESREQVLRIIDYCGEIGLFDRGLLEQSVITSEEIQEHYACVAARRNADRSKYWLLSTDDEFDEADEFDEIDEFARDEMIQDVSAAETRIIAAETPIDTAEKQQSKVKKSKQNKSKVKQQQSKAKQSGAHFRVKNAARHAAAAAAAAVPSGNLENPEGKGDIGARVIADTGPPIKKACGM